MIIEKQIFNNMKCKDMIDKKNSALEFIRQYPLQDMDNIGDKTYKSEGIYELIKYMILESIPRMPDGCSAFIDIYLSDKCIAIADRGEGILHERLEEETKVRHCYTRYDITDLPPKEANPFPLHSIINALSEEFIVNSYRDNKSSEILYRRGVLKSNNSEEHSVFFNKLKSSGITVTFTPDKEIFGEYQFDSKVVSAILKDFEAAYPCLQFRLHDRTADKHRYCIKNALCEYLNRLHENVEIFKKDVEIIDSLTEEQLSRIDRQWFHIENALDNGVDMFGEGVDRLHEEIEGSQSDSFSL